MGTTSAFAENTIPFLAGNVKERNYLRVRGEYLTVMSIDCLLAELPPRARRIPHKIIIGFLNKGTTSACAENTSPHQQTAQQGLNYLRVRGEYGQQSRASLFAAGTTSACAENTLNELGLL